LLRIGMDIVQVSQVTGLTIAQVSRLQEEWLRVSDPLLRLIGSTDVDIPDLAENCDRPALSGMEWHFNEITGWVKSLVW
jgi:hypothetical protein